MDGLGKCFIGEFSQFSNEWRLDAGITLYQDLSDYLKLSTKFHVIIRVERLIETNSDYFQTKLSHLEYKVFPDNEGLRN